MNLFMMVFPPLYRLKSPLHGPYKPWQMPRRACLAEIPPLQVVALHASQQLHLFQGFNALCCYSLAEAMGNIDYTADDRPILWTRYHIGDKTTINLQFSKW